MKNKRWGIPLMALGIVMLLAAFGWAGRNAWEENRAGAASAAVVEEIRAQLGNKPARPAPLPTAVPDREEPKAEPLDLDGDIYIGVLCIPALGLELPVMDTWSYPNLKKSPCRYVGSVEGEDMVIAAHNYKTHFGSLDQLPEGSEVVFITMSGEVMTYQVAATEILAPTAVEDMTSGEYPLTLFTCTYGGKSRVTVRCDWAS